MSMTIHIATEDIAAEFDADPEEMFRVLEILAENTDADQDAIAGQFVDAWSGSLASDRVLPLLLRLADALQVAMYGPRT